MVSQRGQHTGATRCKMVDHDVIHQSNPFGVQVRVRFVEQPQFTVCKQQAAQSATLALTGRKCSGQLARYAVEPEPLHHCFAAALANTEEIPHETQVFDYAQIILDGQLMSHVCGAGGLASVIAGCRVKKPGQNPDQGCFTAAVCAGHQQ